VRRFSVLLALVATAACTPPEDPSRVVEGAWTLEGSPRPLVPATLTLRQLGGVLLGSATIAGLDPVGPGQPVVTVAGSFSSPTVSLDLAIGNDTAAHYAATLDGVGHLAGVWTFSDALGGGADTVSYIRR
jgi:hypothetical protein